MGMINDIKMALKLALGKIKRVDVKILPSQGLFYKKDFNVWIKKVSKKDIQEYESMYVAEDFGVILRELKKIVQKNAIFSNGYKFSNLKSIDVVFLFLEIVKFTKGMGIYVEYIDEAGNKETIGFDEKSFNYFTMDEALMEKWDNVERTFVMDGYKFSLPTIGAENSITTYLISRFMDKTKDSSKYVKYNYDFAYFLGDKDSLTPEEIENLIQIFNYDIEKEELGKIGKIIDMMAPMQKYSLVKDGKTIEISNKINLENIWK